MWRFYFVSSVLGYLLGSFPTGYLVGRAHGIDIREHGSKNMGATNVVRVLGKQPGYLVFLCDAVKGLLAVFLATFFVPPWVLMQLSPANFNLSANLIHSSVLQTHANEAQLAVLSGIVAGLACILGHNFPVWLRFKGGKGVATTVGVLLGLMPGAVGVAAIVWVITYYATRYVSLASLLGAAVLPVAVSLLTAHRGAPGGPPWLLYFSMLAAALIFWRHRANIGRLLNGTEARFARKGSPPPEP